MTTPTTLQLPQGCEQALLKQFLKAEAMALRLVRSAQAQDVPEDVLRFLRRHEEEEDRHLRQFEQMVGVTSNAKASLRVPNQWGVLAVQLYGYEALGFEFAKLLVVVRPDLSSILDDEAVHVGFFENEVRGILGKGGAGAKEARRAAKAWRRRLPGTVDQYLHDESLTPVREAVRER